ncbi:MULTISPECIES: hypothetical protein [Rhizobium]|uniref:hypothetical protein n=1 Tax=Rhizobium TaxID=379 RepID=UPI0007C71183|nr:MULTISPECIES: hypothetical protein [Rhizobium]MCS0463042.1 hypothetical protein [Rhizobium favelukesii]UFS81988.1 hypothetical protein LPB79_27505 [Rhizobium sp. T136]
MSPIAREASLASKEDAKRLSAIRARHAEASTNWQLGSTGTELIAVIGPNTQPVPVAQLTVECGYVDRDFLLHAHDDLRFLLGLLQDAFAEIRRWKPRRQLRAEYARKNANYAAECAMRSNDQMFRRFLLEKKGATEVSDAVRVDSHVRYLLKIDSRNELNTDAGARNRWLELRAEFDAWTGR